MKDNTAKYGAQGKEIASNITDNDSAKMQTSHGLIQGYNSQALIDSKHQVIVHAEAFGGGQDHEHAEPMMTGARENMQAIGHGEDYFGGKIFMVDTNYHSETNLKTCQKLELDAYIPDKHFRRRDPRFAAQRRHWPKKKAYALEDFRYDEARDQYVCPNGKRLRRDTREIYQAVIVRSRYIAEEQDCKRCTLRLKCLTGRGGKRKN